MFFHIFRSPSIWKSVGLLRKSRNKKEMGKNSLKIFWPRHVSCIQKYAGEIQNKNMLLEKLCITVAFFLGKLWKRNPESRFSTNQHALFVIIILHQNKVEIYGNIPWSPTKTQILDVDSTYPLPPPMKESGITNFFNKSKIFVGFANFLSKI